MTAHRMSLKSFQLLFDLKTLPLLNQLQLALLELSAISHILYR